MVSADTSGKYLPIGIFEAIVVHSMYLAEMKITVGDRTNSKQNHILASQFVIKNYQ